MTKESETNAILDGLNSEQRRAVVHGEGPILIIAGAGTGKTKTLVHRVAFLMDRGVAPGRILLLTFTRRAAAEMLRRVDFLLQQLGTPVGKNPRGHSASRAIWGGTFHATAARLIRMYAKSAGLDPDFTILDRSDSEDLMDVARTEQGLSKTDKRFPRKGTCMAIYSHCVNAELPLEDVLKQRYPWCQDDAEQLKGLFRAYGERKEKSAILDYDDLLLFWRGLMQNPGVGEKIRSRFDCVLVDEYQDTNRLQADILQLLCLEGTGLTAVGDDAQSIYSFRAATVRNILDFPAIFPGTTIVKLEQNYRSTQPILQATNRVMSRARNRYTKDLWSLRASAEKPSLVICFDENDQADFLVRQILDCREEGIDLQRQAVLYRASHHSIVLEGELNRCNIPYVKFGGLKFLEAAHIKDVMSFLRLAENPRDLVAGTRVLKLLDGIGPRRARQLMDALIQAGGKFQAWDRVSVPAATRDKWAKLLKLMQRLAGHPIEPASQIHHVREFYNPMLETKYDNLVPRQRDLEQLEQLASRFSDRQTMLTQISLDPPESTGDFAGPPLLDEDYLILSTIHSAKGLEWDVVYVIHAADGSIPSDMATRDESETEEELRLFYVALTRAKDHLIVCYPQRYYRASRGSFSDRHSYAQLTRFLPNDVLQEFECRRPEFPIIESKESADPGTDAMSQRIRQQIQKRWS
ncbi:MAG: ATP-dependent helicase [Pirellulales bacterium]|nr:ATP-dependent helicase [Pirellulales bacterium]